MARYRKKPIVIEAVQFNPDEPAPGVFTDGTRWVVPTPEGPMSVQKGDWIITGVNGETYPCRPDVFEKTYDHVEE